MPMGLSPGRFRMATRQPADISNLVNSSLFFSMFSEAPFQPIEFAMELSPGTVQSPQKFIKGMRRALFSTAIVITIV